MSFKTVLFAFIILNAKFFSISKNPCDRVRFRWDKRFQFPSVLPKDSEDWKDLVCRFANCLLNSGNSSIKSSRENYRKLNHGSWIDVTFPVISESPNITFKRLPRPVLVVKETSSGTASQMLRALGQIWKLFAFCLIAAALSGIIIWFFDHKANSGHFPPSFWIGIREGLWWAIVTATTTGYGDKTPKSTLARAYASLWMIVGLMLMSIITAQVSSIITADNLRPLNDALGDEVGVPLGSLTFFQNYSMDAPSFKEYPTEKELFESLNNGTQDKVWLLNCLSKLDTDPDSTVIVREAKTDVKIGADIKVPRKINKDEELYKTCYANWFNETGQTSENMMDEIKNKCFKIYSSGKYRYTIKWTTANEKKVTDYILFGLAGLLLVFLIIGTLWETWSRRQKKQISRAYNVDVETATTSPGQEMKTMSTLFQNEKIFN